MTPDIPKMIIDELIEACFEARENSYCPYSGFAVGAALYCICKKNSPEYNNIDLFSNEEYTIVTGTNIENASYPAGNCAERTALFKAVSEGIRQFAAIAIVGGKGDEISDYTAPCGICRQTLREFVDPSEFYVIMAKSKDDYIIKTLEELLPMSFGPDNLK